MRWGKDFMLVAGPPVGVGLEGAGRGLEGAALAPGRQVR